MKMRLRHWLLGAIGVLMVLVAAGGAGLWWWTGSDTSLATVLRWAGRFDATRDALKAEDVTGSLRAGGRIGHLQWQRDGLTVDASDVTLQWQALALFDRWLKLDDVHIASLRIADQRAPDPKATPPSPPGDLILPVQIDVKALRVDRLEWAGPPGVTATGLLASYQYDRSRHQLKLQSLDLADGHYQGEAVITDQAPLTLDAQLRLAMQATVPGGTQRVDLNARADLRGPLTRLALTAQLTSRALAGAARQPAANTPPLLLPTANVSAQLEPWATQPVPQADVEFSQLDLGAFWPQAPRTRLNGSLQAEPVAGTGAAQAGQAWRLDANVANQLPGPWDTRHLPLSHLRGRGTWQDNTAQIENLLVTLADASGKPQGQIEGKGQFSPSGADAAWDTKLQLREINPAALHGKMAAARLNGELQAQSRVAAGQPGVDFRAELQSTAVGGAQVAGLRIDKATARGRWAGQLLQLEALQVLAQNAELTASGQADIARESGGGKLTLTAPGLQLLTDGSIGAQQGAGRFELALNDAGPALRWLQQLPGVPAALDGVSLAGKAGLQGSWKGGWRDPAVDARLQVASLEVRRPGQAPAEAIKITNIQATLGGRLSAARLQLDANAATAQQKLGLRLEASGGQTAQGWQGTLASLNLKLEEPQKRPGAWQLATAKPVAGRLANGRWDVAAGQATLTAPDSIAGAGIRQVQIAWQPVSGAPGQLRSAGRIEGLPLAWAEALAGTRLVESGVSSDLVFDGDWDVALADQLRVRANLQRRSGDITLLADDAVPTAGQETRAPSGTRIAAGVREARLSLASDGPAVTASLRWDSAQAGQAEARISTRLTQQDGQWSWPAQAPLQGQLKASLPRISTWSVLAPPGWRVAGTLEANATLAGTRAAPQLDGTLQARGLALRSVVNGIALSEGTLMARLQGNRMRIEAFTLKGAGGGSVTAQGEVAWVDGKPGMTIDAVAQELRVTTQPDRRVTVSGNLKARLANAQLNLDGQLKVDQARIMLPEESAPQLGDDVFVRKPVTTAQAAGPAAPAAQPIKVQLDVQLDLGSDFRLTGLGIDTKLAGKLQLTGDGKTPRLLGTIRTVDGEYRAYGQWLTIEQGVLRFTGPYDNPSLDVLAIRPNLTQRVGVQITGTALAPTVRLYASPDLADSEKLAWLLLGRSSASGGAEAAMLQQAAVALIGGSKSGGGIASRFGLDELSLGGSASSDGTTTSKTSAVTLGKRLSRNFYVAYEASLSGAMGTLFVFYDLSQRFTLRGQSGQESAVDLIFTLRYD